MAKERMPLGISRRTPLKKVEKTIVETPEISPKKILKKAKAKPNPKRGRPSTKQGKKLVKYSMDIHPELKRAVVKTAAIKDKDVHVMWNEILFDWLEKERKKNPEWYTSIKIDRQEL